MILTDTQKPKLDEKERTAKLKRLKILEKKRAALFENIKSAKLKQREYELQNKILYFGHTGKGYLGAYGKWEPNQAQLAINKAFREGNNKIIGFYGANQIGKTLEETFLLLSCIKGHFINEDPEIVGRWIWKKYGWKPPISIRWIGGDWEHHIKETLIEQGLKELVPASWRIETRKNNQGVEYVWNFFEGSEVIGRITFMSNQQPSRRFVGGKLHVICFDEPFPKEIWMENFMRATSKDGIIIIGASLVENNQIWIEEEILDTGSLNLNYVDDETYEERVVEFPVYSYKATAKVNVGFGRSKDGYERDAAYLKRLNPEEYKIRFEGEAAGKKVRLLDIDKERHVIKGKGPQDIRPNWMVDIQIDYHPSKEQYILFFATDENNYKFVFHVICDHGDGSWIGDQIIKAWKTYNLRINSIYADPLSKSGENNFIETEFDKIDNVLNQYGFYLEDAGKLKTAKDDGIMKINSLLKTPNGIIGLYFFDCYGSPTMKKCIDQCRNWKLEEKGDGNLIVSKKNDDFPECLYRAALLDTQYFPPEMEDRKAHKLGEKELSKKQYVSCFY